jgi:hypothetical protein
MYTALLSLHSVLRWLVLLAGLAVVLRSAMGLSGQRRWGTTEERGVKLFVITLDVQTVIGLLLYAVFSPFVRLAMSDIAGAMRDGDLRFWLVEHLFGMVIAVTLAHVGRVKLRKATDDGTRYRTAVTFMGIALAVILLSIPWPGMPSARPLFRF